jgi:EPS-associated MarR family transcriptional regulator
MSKWTESACSSYNVQVITKLRGAPSGKRFLDIVWSCGGLRKAWHRPKLRKNAIDDMTSRQAKLQEDTYFRVMSILQENPDFTQRELADRLGISLGALNYCLRALIEKGLVKMRSFAGSKNKFGYVYVLTPSGLAEKAAMTQRFLQRKVHEYEALKAEIEALMSQIEELGDEGAKKCDERILPTSPGRPLDVPFLFENKGSSGLL